MGDFYRYSHAAPADQPAAPEGAQAQPTYLHRGTIRVTMRDGQGTTENVHQVTGATATPVQPAAVPVDFSGARSQEGMPRSHAMMDRDTLIRVGGIETTVGDAERMGLVRHDPSKGWMPAEGSEGNGEGTQPDKGDDKAAKSEGNQPLDEKSEAYLSEAFDKANGAAVGAAMDLIEAGEVSTSRVERLAADLGIEPSEAAARIEHVQAAYLTEAVGAAAKYLGGDAELAAEVLEWAGEAIPGKAQEAALAHFTTGRADYSGLVQEWLAALPESDPETALGATMPAGCSVYRDSTSGAVLVRLPHGGVVEWSAAVRGGLLRVAPRGAQRGRR